jgi:RnfABCDGE-type electron transport complex B subunit
MTVLVSALLMLALSLVLGILVAVFARVFEVKENPAVALVEAVLPAYNCGKCGYPGCLHYAEAVVNSGERPDKCSPGGKTVTDAVRKIMAKNSSETGNKK